MSARDALNLNQFPCEGRGPAPNKQSPLRGRFQSGAGPLPSQGNSAFHIYRTLL